MNSTKTQTKPVRKDINDVFNVICRQHSSIPWDQRTMHENCHEYKSLQNRERRKYREVDVRMKTCLVRDIPSSDVRTDFSIRKVSESSTLLFGKLKSKHQSLDMTRLCKFIVHTSYYQGIQCKDREVMKHE
jgi:hypothetical protein